MAEHDPHEGGFEPTGEIWRCIYQNKDIHFCDFSGVSASNMGTGTDEGESCSDEQDDQTENMQIRDDGSGIEEQFTAYTDSPHMVSEFISQVTII